MQKLALITTHPIQYHSPWFRLLAQQLDLSIKVFFTWGQSQEGNKYDPGFQKEINWDIPLLEGFEYEFLKNTAKDPGSHHFKGIINPTIIEKIDQFNPHAILVFGWSFHSHLKVMRHYKGKVKVLFRGDSTLLDEPKGVSFKKTLRRFFLKWVYQHIDAALYVGESNKAYFLKHGVKSHQLVFAPHAVDHKRFCDDLMNYEEKARSWKKNLGIAGHEIVFLFAGKLEAKKHTGLLIDAFKQINNQHIRLILVGNGPLEKELKEMAKNDQRILFLPFQNQVQMPVVYRLGHVFVLPSKGPGETWGLAVNEAMACSRPVIASDKVGCASDLIANGQNGFIFKLADKEDLKEKLFYFIKNKKAITEFGEKSFDIIQHWSLEKICEAIEHTISADQVLNVEQQS